MQPTWRPKPFWPGGPACCPAAGSPRSSRWWHHARASQSPARPACWDAARAAVASLRPSPSAAS
eukprot:3380825-Pyramimonas_sp.AAC.1